MTKDTPILEVVPSGGKNSIFEQRESGKRHSAYALETELYTAIKNGDVKRFDAAMRAYFESGINAGTLSDDPLRQTQYFAVSCIALATRSAMEGGLAEIVAYNLSDRYIQIVDKMKDSNEIIGFLVEKAAELTAMVAAVHEKAYYPAAVKKCVKYIDKNLHEKITLVDLAAECGLSGDYLSALFKKHIGMPPSRYIMHKKLEASKELLNDGKYEMSEVGYFFSFCSETYYISCFKREYGMTPREYINRTKTV